MKKQNSIYFALAILFTASLACNIAGTAPSTEVEQQPTAVDKQKPTPESGETSPVATAVPSQQAASSDGAAGPETIDLTNPALYIIPGAPAFIYKRTIKYTGVDKTGGAKEVSDIGLVEVQTQPQTTQHFLSSLEGYMDPPGSTGSVNILSSDTVIIDDKMYIRQLVSTNGGTPKLFCNNSLASNMQGPGMLESTLAPIVQFQKRLTGQASRVESGIEVNGFVTDKYELPSKDSDGSAFVYVARDGGFITLYETQGRDKIDYYGLDPNQFTDVSLAYNFIPVEDGSLDIAIHPGCDNPAGLAGEFPVMDGAIKLTTLIGQVSYEIGKPRSEVADYYRAEMPKRGWSLTKEGKLIGISLVFTKDGKNVEVTVVSRNGDTSAFVAITEK